MHLSQSKILFRKLYCAYYIISLVFYQCTANGGICHKQYNGLYIFVIKRMGKKK